MTTTPTIQAIRRNDHATVPFVSAAGNNGGDVVALGDGRIGVVAGLESIATGATGALFIDGQFDLTKANSTDVYAYAAEVFWDPTNLVAQTTYAAGLLYAGRCVIAAVSGGTMVRVDLNVQRPQRDPFATVAATGSVQGDAAAIEEGFAYVTGADATKGVILPVAVPGMTVTVKNSDTANAILKVYGQTGAAINALTANAAISMAAKTSATFKAISPTQWFTIPLVPS